MGINTPAAGAIVTGVINVGAAAGDPSGVSQVQFKVDGANIGPADTSAPYSTQWGSINVANGSHTLTAVARDSLGNTTTSAGVTVNVNNQDGAPVNALPPRRRPRTRAAAVRPAAGPAVAAAEEAAVRPTSRRRSRS